MKNFNAAYLSKVFDTVSNTWKNTLGKMNNLGRMAISSIQKNTRAVALSTLALWGSGQALAQDLSETGTSAQTEILTASEYSHQIQELEKLNTFITKDNFENIRSITWARFSYEQMLEKKGFQEFILHTLKTKTESLDSIVDEAFFDKVQDMIDQAQVKEVEDATNTNLVIQQTPTVDIDTYINRVCDEKKIVWKYGDRILDYKDIQNCKLEMNKGFESVQNLWNEINTLSEKLPHSLAGASIDINAILTELTIQPYSTFINVKEHIGRSDGNKWDVAFDVKAFDTLAIKNIEKQLQWNQVATELMHALKNRHILWALDNNNNGSINAPQKQELNYTWVYINHLISLFSYINIELADKYTESDAEAWEVVFLNGNTSTEMRKLRDFIKYVQTGWTVKSLIEETHDPDLLAKLYMEVYNKSIFTTESAQISLNEAEEKIKKAEKLWKEKQISDTNLDKAKAKISSTIENNIKTYLELVRVAHGWNTSVKSSGSKRVPYDHTNTSNTTLANNRKSLNRLEETIESLIEIDIQRGKSDTETVINTDTYNVTETTTIGGVIIHADIADPSGIRNETNFSAVTGESAIQSAILSQERDHWETGDGYTPSLVITNNDGTSFEWVQTPLGDITQIHNAWITQDDIPYIIYVDGTIVYWVKEVNGVIETIEKTEYLKKKKEFEASMSHKTKYKHDWGVSSIKSSISTKWNLGIKQAVHTDMFDFIPWFSEVYGLYHKINTKGKTYGGMNLQIWNFSADFSTKWDKTFWYNAFVQQLTDTKFAHWVISTWDGKKFDPILSTSTQLSDSEVQKMLDESKDKFLKNPEFISKVNLAIDKYCKEYSCTFSKSQRERIVEAQAIVVWGRNIPWYFDIDFGVNLRTRKLFPTLSYKNFQAVYDAIEVIDANNTIDFKTHFDEQWAKYVSLDEVVNWLKIYDISKNEIQVRWPWIWIIEDRIYLGHDMRIATSPDRNETIITASPSPNSTHPAEISHLSGEEVSIIEKKLVEIWKTYDSHKHGDFHDYARSNLWDTFIRFWSQTSSIWILSQITEDIYSHMGARNENEVQRAEQSWSQAQKNLRMKRLTDCKSTFDTFHKAYNTGISYASCVIPKLMNQINITTDTEPTVTHNELDSSIAWYVAWIHGPVPFSMSKGKVLKTIWKIVEVDGYYYAQLEHCGGNYLVFKKMPNVVDSSKITRATIHSLEYAANWAVEQSKYSAQIWIDITQPEIWKQTTIHRVTDTITETTKTVTINGQEVWSIKGRDATLEWLRPSPSDTIHVSHPATPNQLAMIHAGIYSSNQEITWEQRQALQDSIWHNYQSENAHIWMSPDTHLITNGDIKETVDHAMHWVADNLWIQNWIWAENIEITYINQDRLDENTWWANEIGQVADNSRFSWTESSFIIESSTQSSTVTNPPIDDQVSEENFAGTEVTRSTQEYWTGVSTYHNLLSLSTIGSTIRSKLFPILEDQNNTDCWEIQPGDLCYNENELNALFNQVDSDSDPYDIPFDESIVEDTEVLPKINMTEEHSKI